MKRCEHGICWQIGEDICCKECILHDKLGCEDQCRRTPENCGRVKEDDNKCLKE